MINIRNGVFETNSSSSHSICIKNSENICPLELHEMIDKNGNLFIPEEDLCFYRSPFRILTTPFEKLRYAIAQASCYTDAEEYIEQLESLVRSYNPEFSHFVFELDRYGHPKDPRYGGTDDYILNNWLRTHKVSIENFITNDKYFVVCDGDEYNIFDGMVRCGLVDKSKIEID